jgi:hypothetical protein
MTPIKLAPAEARRRLVAMIEDHKWRIAQLDTNTAKGAEIRMQIYWDKLALEMALEAMREKAHP